MTTYYEEDYKGHNIKIEYDEYPENPREAWDNFGHMICFHSRYDLGDKHNHSNPIDFCTDLLSDLTEENLQKILLSIEGLNEEDKEEIKEDPVYFMESNIGPDDIDFCLNALSDHFVMLPLFLYDHSGITMNTSGFSCPWDSGQVGIIYVSNEEIVKEFGKGKKAREKAANLLRSEVEAYDRFLTGQVFGFVVEDEDGEYIDSCCGFYEDPEGYPLTEARKSVDWHISKQHKEAVKETIQAIKEVVLEMRQEEKMILAGII